MNVMQIINKFLFQNIFSKKIQFLYKYYKLPDESGEMGIKNTWLFELLVKRKIRFKSILKLNDPFDGRTLVDTRFHSSNNRTKKELFKLHAKSLGSDIRFLTDKKRFEFILKSFLDIRPGKLFNIFCMSEIKDDILMWAHYADSHKGFLIIFDKSKLTPNKELIIKIDYVNSFLPLKYFLSILKGNLKLATNFLKNKSSHWSYEKEWRMLAKKETDADVDFEDFFFPKGSMVGIVFGMDMEEKFKRQIESIVQSEKLDLQIWQAVMDQHSYGVKIVDYYEYKQEELLKQSILNEQKKNTK